MSHMERTKYLGSKWRAMSEEERRPWIEQSEINQTEWRAKRPAPQNFSMRPLYLFKKDHLNDPKLAGLTGANYEQTISKRKRQLTAMWMLMSEEQKKPWKERSDILLNEWREKRRQEGPSSQKFYNKPFHLFNLLMLFGLFCLFVYSSLHILCNFLTFLGLSSLLSL